MTPDPFEQKLASLAGSLHRPDPTPAWRSGILDHARREASASPVSPHLRPPRWLLAVWGAAWLAIACLRLTTPDVPSSSSPAASSATVSHLPPQAPPAATREHRSPSPSTLSLLAFHREVSAAYLSQQP